jgi:hypothetical protein
MPSVTDNASEICVFIYKHWQHFVHWRNSVWISETKIIYGKSTMKIRISFPLIWWKTGKLDQKEKHLLTNWIQRFAVIWEFPDQIDIDIGVFISGICNELKILLETLVHYIQISHIFHFIKSLPQKLFIHIHRMRGKYVFCSLRFRVEWKLWESIVGFSKWA